MYEKVLTVFQKPNANDWTFIETKLKALVLHKKTISSNHNQNTNKKTDENRKKTTNIGLAYVQFYETKLHRGRKRRWV